MTSGAAERPRLLHPTGRRWISVVGLVVLVVAIGPLFGLSQEYLFAEALRWSLLAIVVPALVTIGAPWSSIGLAKAPPPDSVRSAGDDDVVAVVAGRPFDRLAAGRRRHPELVRALGYLVLDVAVMVAWRTPDAVDAIRHHGWLLAPEAVTLVMAGIGLWLELVSSPPLEPRVARPWPAVLAAFAMWSVWIIAYAVGLSNSVWYGAFHHHAGGLSAVADQQFSTVVLWAVAAVAFSPIVFWNVYIWLRAPDDSDVELRRLVRDDHRLGPFPQRPGDTTSRAVPPT